MPIPIEIFVSDLSQGGEQFYVQVSMKAVATVCEVIGLDMSEELSIAIVNQKEIQALNKSYRDKDKPTNVLSFPMDGQMLLGDIVLAPAYIKREAEDQNKIFNNHLTHLIIHGFLHLLGYDHETDKDALEMETIEIAALGQLGIDNPYELKDFRCE